MPEKPYRPRATRPPDKAASAVEQELNRKARAIHERVIVLDSHIDFEPIDLMSDRNYSASKPSLICPT
jgi:hypothetical protein